MISLRIEYKNALKTARNSLKTVEQSIVSAINKLRNRAYTEAHRKIREDYLIKQSDITRAIKERKNATRNHPVANILAEDKRIPLSKFFARQYPSGVVAQVRRSSIPRLIPRAWKAPEYGGVLFIRKKKGEKRVLRYPRESLMGPAVAGLFNSKAVENEISDVINNEWIEIWEHEYDYYRGIIE